jgi:hypothetical protein
MNDTAPSGPVLDPAALAIAAPGIAPPQVAEAGAEMPPTLPRDHPAWQRDVVAVSARVRKALAQLRPIAVRVLTFWDHVVRSVVVGGRRIEVDPSGCYRLR